MTRNGSECAQSRQQKEGEMVLESDQEPEQLFSASVSLKRICDDDEVLGLNG